MADDLVYAGGTHRYATSAADGTERWRYELDEGVVVTSSPAVVDGVVYFGDNAGGCHALDASDGGERWHVDLGEARVHSPAVVDGAVYVGTGDGVVVALH